MTETGGHEAPSPLVETNWLAERLDNPDLRILDCSVIMNVTDDGTDEAFGRSPDAFAAV